MLTHPREPASMISEMSYHNDLIQKLRQFRDERDWEQFHNAKDLALAINVEAGELLEAFLWKKDVYAKAEKVQEELADVFTYALLLADKLDLDVEAIVLKKMEENEKKYPVEKAKGTAKKYTEL